MNQFVDHLAAEALMPDLPPKQPAFSPKDIADKMTPSAEIQQPLPQPIQGAPIVINATPVPVTQAPTQAAPAPQPAQHHINWLSAITMQMASWMPAVVATVTAIESLAPNATGPQKASMGVTALSQSLGASSNPQIAGIGALINLAVLLANLGGTFVHKTASAA
jgi:hypothetical protein